MFFESLTEPWKVALKDLEDSIHEIEERISSAPYIPRNEDVFRALGDSPDSARVLIVGQDPYPNPEHAMGLAFSVPKSIAKLPPSLKNIFIELQNDLGGEPRTNGDLSDWAAQGVVLLNRTLTLLPGESNSHINVGWRKITEKMVELIEPNIQAAILWGNNAQEIKSLITPSKLIMGVHPSPLSAYKGFFGSRPFSAVNEKLRRSGVTEIVW